MRLAIIVRPMFPWSSPEAGMQADTNPRRHAVQSDRSSPGPGLPGSFDAYGGMTLMSDGGVRGPECRWYEDEMKDIPYAFLFVLPELRPYEPGPGNLVSLRCRGSFPKTDAHGSESNDARNGDHASAHSCVCPFHELPARFATVPDSTLRFTFLVGDLNKDENCLCAAVSRQKHNAASPSKQRTVALLYQDNDNVETEVFADLDDRGWPPIVSTLFVSSVGLALRSASQDQKSPRSVFRNPGHQLYQDKYNRMRRERVFANQAFSEITEERRQAHETRPLSFANSHGGAQDVS
ncbi:hypothetical protein LZ30DRAFT_688371 [Colletotrichum cereale]|nr:hypothetical protein LZ30DRAFT_688371 [Colletotrichum cereale]